MAQRQLVGNHRAIPAARDGKQHHAEVRNRRDDEHAEKEQAAGRGFPASDAQRRRAPLRPRRGAERRAAHDRLRHRENPGRDDEHHGGERVGNRVSIKSLEPVENLHRCDPRVVENQRHAELGEGPDENDRSAREHPGHRERQSDPEEALPRRAAEVFRGLLHRRIEVRQRGGDVHVEDRIEVQRVHHHDPGEAAVRQPVVGQRCVHQAAVDEQGVECAVHPEHLFHSDRADEGRQDHWREDENTEHRLPEKVVSMTDERQRKSDGQGRQGARDSQREGIPKSLAIDRIPENRDDEIQGEKVRAIRPCPFESLLHDHPRRVDEKHREQHADDNRDGDGGAAFHRVVNFARAITSALR